MPVETIGVIGAGIMGSGIAQVAAVAGYNVVFQDIRDEALSSGMRTIERGLERAQAKQKITAEDAKDALKRIESTTKLSPFDQVDLSIEAVVENVDVKVDIFRERSGGQSQPAYRPSTRYETELG